MMQGAKRVIHSSVGNGIAILKMISVSSQVTPGLKTLLMHEQYRLRRMVMAPLLGYLSLAKTLVRDGY
jgi:hypothetical protein